MIPQIVFVNKLDNKKQHGAYLYTDKNQDDCKILISKDSDDPSDTLIHEMIHHTIKEMKNDEIFEKLAHRIFRREDFIAKLSRNLSKNLKFEIRSQKTSKEKQNGK